MADVDHKPEDVFPAAVVKVEGKVDRGAMGDIKAMAPKTSASKKKVSRTKPRSAVSDEHPKYSVMIADAISQLKERGGSSRQAILGYITSHYRVGTEVNKINARVKMALKAGVKSQLLKQTKGTGASGSFRLGQRQKTSQKTTHPRPSTTKKATGSGKSVAKKSAIRKPKSPAKKTAPKKAKSPAKMAKSPAKKTKAAPKKMKTTASKAKPKSAEAKKSNKPMKKSAVKK